MSNPVDGGKVENAVIEDWKNRILTELDERRLAYEASAMWSYRILAGIEDARKQNMFAKSTDAPREAHPDDWFDIHDHIDLYSWARPRSEAFTVLDQQVWANAITLARESWTRDQRRRKEADELKAATCDGTRSVGGGCMGYEDDRCTSSVGHEGECVDDRGRLFTRTNAPSVKSVHDGRDGLTPSGADPSEWARK